MKLTRRGFMISAGVLGGGLVLGTVGVATWIAAYDQRTAHQAVLSNRKMVTGWLSISLDGHVTVHGPHVEMGQGTQTSLLQIVLDEMDADPAKVSYELAPADPAFTMKEAMEVLMAEMGGMPTDTSAFLRKFAGRASALMNLQFTGGSMSLRLTGWHGMRPAAASARMMIAQAGADALGVDVSEVRTERGVVLHDASGQSIGYGEVVDAASLMAIPEKPTFKDPQDYAYIGKRFPRIDLPEKVFGEPVYGIDIDVPGMRYAAVAPPPIAEGIITGVSNRAQVEERRGVEAVIILDKCVAVVADNPWRAEQAVRALNIECTPGEGGKLDNDTLVRQRIAAVTAGGETVRTVGEELESLTGDDIVEATYVTPFYVHVPMEPLNATVWEEDGKHHVATGTQGPLNTRRAAAEVLGRDFEDVVLHCKTMGGGFGRRNALIPAALDWIRAACAIQKAVGGAVKMTWSREAGMRMGTFHPADAAYMRARLGADGLPTEWLSDAYAELMSTEEIDPPYLIPNITIRHVAAEPALPYGAWRSVQVYTAVHFTETFVDELAKKAGRDPLEYRLAMLEPRKAAVLQVVADMAGYTGSRVGNRGYGISMTQGFGSVGAAIAEVSLEEGVPRVHRVWSAIDCGIPVNPASVEGQVRGSIYWGVSAAMWGRVRFEDGAMVESNLHNYKVATFHGAPRVEVTVMTDTGSPVGGVGEVGAPLAGPAIVNAISALTDRPRTLPLIT